MHGRIRGVGRTTRALGRAGKQTLICLLMAACGFGQGAEPTVHSLHVQQGNLAVVFRDNSESPMVLSGLQSLFHTATPEFDAFDPDTPGASAGLNFEHIICGHPDPSNAFSPRHGGYHLIPGESGAGARLVRRAEDSPWKVASRFSYELKPPHYVDFEFNCTPQAAVRFGERGYAVLFFANYMNDVAEVPIVFRGVSSAAGQEEWVEAGAPAGHEDYRSGGTYRNVAASDLEYDADHNFKLNLWSYDYPRYTKPFYYGRVAHGMVFMLMFDRAWSELDEIRFSLFKFKVPKHPRPAWDFQYVIHRVEPGRDYGFKGRLVWKPFISKEDCLAEYQRWAEK